MTESNTETTEIEDLRRQVRENTEAIKALSAKQAKPQENTNIGNLVRDKPFMEYNDYVVVNRHYWDAVRYMLHELTNHNGRGHVMDDKEMIQYAQNHPEAYANMPPLLRNLVTDLIQRHNSQEKNEGQTYSTSRGKRKN